VRALTASDGAAARALVHSVYARSRYVARTLELLDQALDGNDPECVGMVLATVDAVDAMILHGSIAGASAVRKIHTLVGRDVETLASLVDALRRSETWRMIVCELPEDDCHAIPAEALAQREFTREGSVRAFFDEQTDLALYVSRRGTVSG
jgi:hypothetical protein